MAGLAGVFELEKLGAGAFRGAPSAEGGARVYGGHSAAQSLLAAFRTVELDWECRVLQSHFPRAGDATKPIDYRVEHVATSRNFALRQVIGSQDGKVIIASSASFQLPRDGLAFQYAGPPSVPLLETLARETDLYAEAIRVLNPDARGIQMLPSGIDARWCDPQNIIHPSVRDGANPMWMRLTQPIGATLLDRQVAIAFLSDFGMIEPGLRVHGFSFLVPEGLLASTLDHNIWFHRDSDAGQWHLRDTVCRSTHGGRAFMRAEMFDAAGALVVSIAQEGVMYRA